MGWAARRAARVAPPVISTEERQALWQQIWTWYRKQNGLARKHKKRLAEQAMTQALQQLEASKKLVQPATGGLIVHQGSLIVPPGRSHAGR